MSSHISLQTIKKKIIFHKLHYFKIYTFIVFAGKFRTLGLQNFDMYPLVGRLITNYDIN